MSIKRILLSAFLFIITIFFSVSWVEAGQTCAWTWTWKLTWEMARWCINSTEFAIDVWTFSPGGDSELATWDSTTETVNNVLATIIANLIVAFWVLSLLVMTIGGWYMIFHAWEESLLSRWKSIFIYGLVSLAIALSAWIIVQLVTYLLYTVD